MRCNRPYHPSFLLSAILLLAPLGVPIFAEDVWTSLHNGGNTSVRCKNLPLQWSPNRGVAWTKALPGYGQSAPVVWHGRAYVTAVEGDNKEWCHVLAFATESGKLLWKRKFPAKIRQRNSYMTSRAAPTPLVDKQGVYVLFGSGDLRAFTHQGKQRWQLELFDDAKQSFQNGHGYGSSPAQTANAVIVLVDHRGPSYLLAVSKRTGKTLWKTPRKSRSSWTSPRVARVGNKTQIVVSSTGTVDGYDAQTGKQLWSHQGLSGNTIPSVTVQGNLVYVGAAISQRQPDAKASTASNCCLEITPDSKKGYKLLWKARKTLCHYVSPFAHRGRVYYVNKVGAVCCLDGKSGKRLNTKRLAGPCWAQPIACGDRIYLFHKDGRTTVLQEGPKMKILAVNRLWKEDSPPLPSRNYDYEPEGPNDPRPAKPAPRYQDPLVYGVAAVDHNFLVRIGTHLYCVRSVHIPDHSPAPCARSLSLRRATGSSEIVFLFDVNAERS